MFFLIKLIPFFSGDEPFVVWVGVCKCNEMFFWPEVLVDHLDQYLSLSVLHVVFCLFNLLSHKAMSLLS